MLGNPLRSARFGFASAGLLGLLALSCTPAHAQTSTFSTNTEGWQIVSFNNLSTSDYGVAGTYTPTYNATGGNPGGYISTTDPDGGDFTFAAPSLFLGNKTGATTLSYDLQHTDNVNYQTSDVMLVGGGERLLYKFTPDFVPSTTFSTVTVGFTPSSNWTVNTTTGAAATANDFATVLGSLSGLYIRGEYTFGGETAGLDNVVLNSPAAPPPTVPEPGSVAMLVGMGVTGAGFLLRRRKAVRNAA